MDDGIDRRPLAVVLVVGGLATVPAVAGAQPLDPSTVTGASPIWKALGSFVLVTAVGAGYLSRYGGLVDRAVADTMDRPVIAVIYGLFAYVLVLFFSVYALDVLTRVGVTGTPLGYVVFAVLSGGVLGVTGLGYLVVGTLVTDLYAGRRRWYGLALGGALSAVAWLVLPSLPAAAVWVFVAAVGVGGRTRTWVHSERAIEADVQS